TPNGPKRQVFSPGSWRSDGVSCFQTSQLARQTKNRPGVGVNKQMLWYNFNVFVGDMSQTKKSPHGTYTKQALTNIHKIKTNIAEKNEKKKEKKKKKKKKK
ncbi:hypothetical protein, partial [Escherichia coli]|uniref:hypothetical protein n=1 Tax=Escherichia coli TaxID=562 RepID=UPI001BAFCA9B